MQEWPPSCRERRLRTEDTSRRFSCPTPFVHEMTCPPRNRTPTVHWMVDAPSHFSASRGGDATHAFTRMGAAAALAARVCRFVCSAEATVQFYDSQQLNHFSTIRNNSTIRHCAELTARDRMLDRIGKAPTINSSQLRDAKHPHTLVHVARVPTRMTRVHAALAQRVCATATRRAR